MKERSPILLILILAMLRPGPVAAQVDVVELSIDDIQTAYADQSYSAIDLVQAYLERIQRHEETYNAFISLNPGAISRAAALDETYAKTGPVGPLHGIPVVVKDNIDVSGLRTTAGFAGFASEAGGIDLIPSNHSSVVQRLMDAGAIILGKTNMPDFAFSGTRSWSSLAGATKNPYNVALAPGGSSGGTATAVNASFAVLGLGTETGGSIQNPSSAQALVGVKPTFGLVPLDGVVPLDGEYRDVVGPMARTVRDAAVTLEVLSGPNTDLTTALTTDSLQGKRFGLVGAGWPSPFLPLAPETEDLYAQAIDVLRAEGAEVVADPFSASFGKKYRERDEPRGLFALGLESYLQALGENAAVNSIAEWEELSGRRLGVAPTNPRGPSDAARSRFEQWQNEMRSLFADTLREHNLNGLFFPQAARPIPGALTHGNGLNNFPELPSNIVNDLGVPVVTVPFSYYEDASPMSLAFIGDMGSEADLLAFAYDFEHATLARRSPQLDSSQRSGDFDNNGVLDVADINLLGQQVSVGAYAIRSDLNLDLMVDSEDVRIWVKDLRNTWIGDADLDGVFDSSDLISVLFTGAYGADVEADWSSGDFDGNGRFASGDLALALADGGYEAGPRPAAVPEPMTATTLLVSLVAVAARSRIHQVRVGLITAVK